MVSIIDISFEGCCINFRLGIVIHPRVTEMTAVTISRIDSAVSKRPSNDGFVLSQSGGSAGTAYERRRIKKESVEGNVRRGLIPSRSSPLLVNEDSVTVELIV